MGIRCRGCVDVMWGRQTLLSCLKTNDLLTWLSPDDTFPPSHQHQYLGRLNYQNRPSLSLLGYKVKELVFAQEKNCYVADILQLRPWWNFPSTRFVVNQCYISYFNFFPYQIRFHMNLTSYFNFPPIRLTSHQKVQLWQKLVEARLPSAPANIRS